MVLNSKVTDFSRINSGISSNKKINLNNSSGIKVRRLLHGHIYNDYEYSEFNLNDNFQKNYQNSYDSLRSRYNFDSSNDSLKSSRIFAGSNDSLYSVDYPDETNRELKEKPIQTKSYKLERKDKSSGISNYLKKLDTKYETILEKLLGFEHIEINKFTDKPVENKKELALKVFTPILLFLIISIIIMTKLIWHLPIKRHIYHFRIYSIVLSINFLFYF
ncbi:uncharacterized protein PMUG01_13067200 [Plasmodium malariae]|uniref:Pv-fam-d protein n=1 Tax=Plasmodium malariae TaxID=5858 RepID=A0A1D3TDN0_PLAMA|nr:uncharacterized protein PMUG01_13067200 [Plasmodium malariae]SCP03027.1 hypothetical protein PMUG01_13067200 [Plasmodium malariae]